MSSFKLALASSGVRLANIAIVSKTLHLMTSARLNGISEDHGKG
jgi:hypothetical protein